MAMGAGVSSIPIDMNQLTARQPRRGDGRGAAEAPEIVLVACTGTPERARPVSSSPNRAAAQRAVSAEGTKLCTETNALGFALAARSLIIL